MSAELDNLPGWRWFAGGEGYKLSPGLALALAYIFKNSFGIMIELDRIFFSKLT